VSEHREIYPVRICCRVLEISHSGYYRWVSAPISERERENNSLIRDIEQIHDSSRKTYGSPRIHAQLKAIGRKCGRGRVERLMRKFGIRSKLKRRFRKTTDSGHSERIAPNLVRREFTVEKPNRTWVSDVTYLWTNEGWLYLAVTLDLFSRKVVGWSMSEKLTTDLVLDCLNAAVYSREIDGELIHHSDRGREYASYEFKSRLNQQGILQSMSRRADCWDNAVAESFFHTLKAELTERKSFTTRDEAREKVFEWIEVFYNRQRLHSTLGYQTPAVYEQTNAA
jgi:putative transposase